MSAEDPGDGERELEEFLRRLGPEAPDARRREEARRAFLAAGSEARSRPAFGARTGNVDDADESDGFVTWLAARAPAAPPAGEARRRARLAFLSAVAALPPSRRTRPAFRRWVLVLAAAAILAVTFLLPEPERWQVEIGGPLRFARSEYAAGEDARLGADLANSGLVETGGERTRFSLAGLLELELQAGSQLQFPPLQELDGFSPIVFELALGEAFVRTREGYPGNPIVVRTGPADVTLHGTTVGVLVDELGTCVCVAEGRVRVTGPRLGAGLEVGSRATLRLYFDPSKDPVSEPFPEGDGPATAHTRALEDFLAMP